MSDRGGELPSALRIAAWRGSAAFAVVALAGQIPPLLIQVFGGGLAWITAVKLGWLYMLSFHRVAIEVRGLSLPARETTQLVHVQIALLTGTALALWLLYRAGAAAASRAGDRTLPRVVVGASVGVSYALLMLGVTVVTRLELVAGGGFFPEVVTFAGVPWRSFAAPFSMGVVAGGLAGLLGSPALDGRLRGWLTAGARTFAISLGLALVALLVFATVRPTGTRAYARALGSPQRAALTVGNQVLALPNHAVFVLVPAMGGCVSLRSDEASEDVLCANRFPLLDSRLLPALSELTVGRDPEDLTRPMRSLALFALAPLLAVVAGGRLAARDGRGRSGRLAAATGSAVVFAFLTGAAAWASSVGFDAVDVETGTGVATGAVLGPSPLEAVALAAAWGLGGAVVGALLPDRRQDAGEPLSALGAAEAPPRPTSL